MLSKSCATFVVEKIQPSEDILEDLIPIEDLLKVCLYRRHFKPILYLQSECI